MDVREHPVWAGWKKRWKRSGWNHPPSRGTSSSTPLSCRPHPNFRKGTCITQTFKIGRIYSILILKTQIRFFRQTFARHHHVVLTLLLLATWTPRFQQWNKGAYLCKWSPQSPQVILQILWFGMPCKSCCYVKLIFVFVISEPEMMPPSSSDQAWLT